MTEEKGLECELDASELGTQEYWDCRYKMEIENFKDHGEVGEIWFGEESMQRVCQWITKQNKINKNSRIIDLGCGNGLLLIELAKNGYTELSGIDYSAEAINLAEDIAKKECFNIDYKIVDLLHEFIPCTYFIAHDKGTYDAISLMSNAKESRLTYIDKVHGILEQGGFFIITSCNWTQTELEKHFTGKFYLFYVIPTPTISFGGQTGKTVTTLVFTKC